MRYSVSYRTLTNLRFLIFFLRWSNIHRDSFFFFLNDPAPPEISPLPLHAALPISWRPVPRRSQPRPDLLGQRRRDPDRKSTRLNSSHSQISYAVFCLKKKKYSSHYPTSFQQKIPLTSLTDVQALRPPLYDDHRHII